MERRVEEWERARRIREVTAILNYSATTRQSEQLEKRNAEKMRKGISKRAESLQVLSDIHCSLCRSATPVVLSLSDFFNPEHEVTPTFPSS